MQQSPMGPRPPLSTLILQASRTRFRASRIHRNRFVYGLMASRKPEARISLRKLICHMICNTVNHQHPRKVATYCNRRDPDDCLYGDVHLRRVFPPSLCAQADTTVVNGSVGRGNGTPFIVAGTGKPLSGVSRSRTQGWANCVEKQTESRKRKYRWTCMPYHQTVPSNCGQRASQQVGYAKHRGPRTRI
jgi:hypothetical protein